MLVLTRSIESLRAAEFKMHEKCFKDYTRIVPPKRPRTKATEAYTTPEDGEMVGGYAMRKRSKVEYNDNVVDEDKGDSEMVVDESLDEQNFNIVPEIEVGQTQDSDEDFISCNTTKSTDINMAVIDVSSTNQDLDETLPFEKGKSDHLFEYIQKHIVDDNHCVSMKTLTDIFGLNGSDRRNRHYVK